MSPKQERGTRQSVEFLTSRIILRKEVTLLFIESRKAKPQNNKVSTCDPTWECFKGQAVFGTPKLDHREEFYYRSYPIQADAEAAQTPGSSKKSAFDLQAGLSHPLNYKPRKGKLKPRGTPKKIVL